VKHQRLAGRAFVIGVLPLLAVTTTAHGAQAYMQDPNGCNDSSITWSFTGSSRWTDDKKTWVRAGINKLNDALDYDGTQLVSVAETGGVDVDIRDPIDNTYGSSECLLGDSIWVNSNFSTSQFYYKVGRHEMFHLAGAEHGGQYDSWDGIEPTTMSTCMTYTDFLTTNSFVRDDHAYENWLHSSLPDRQLTPNIGFEQGTSFWSESGSATLGTVNSGGATGPGYLTWNSTSNSNYLYTTSRVITGDDNEEYRGRVNAKSPSGAYTTQVKAALWRRTVNLPQNPQNPNGCSYEDGILNANGEPTSFGAWTLSSESPFTTVSTSWTGVNTSWVNPSAAEAYDFRIRFYGTAPHDLNSTYGLVHVDNVRAEGT